MPPHTCFRWVAGVIAAIVFTSVRLPAQAGSPAFEVASLREDVRLLSQRLNEISLRVEQLERANGDLQAKSNQAYVTLAQLNEALAALQKTLQAAMREQRRETLQVVSGQM